MRTFANIEPGHPTSGWTALAGEFTFIHHGKEQEQRFDSRCWNGGLDSVDPLNNAEFEHLMKTTLARIAERDKIWGAVGTAGGGVSVDLKPVLTAIAAEFDAEEARDKAFTAALAKLTTGQTTIGNQIAGVDEEVLKSLKATL